MAQFCHLHCHSEYSLLDGMSRISGMVQRAKEMGQPALALTDHGVMFGVEKFYRVCRAEGVRPILGMEAYLARRGAQDRDPKLDASPYHLLLLAQDAEGYRNLLHLASRAQLDGFYYKPRVDREMLAAHNGGLLVTSGCLASELPRLIVEEGEATAEKALTWYLDLFGPDRFFLEVQPHEITELGQVNQVLRRWRTRYGLRLLATNDVHYVAAQDAPLHDVLLCVQTRALRADTRRMRLEPTGSYSLASAEEMEARLRRYLPDDEVAEALATTLAVAERCQVELAMNVSRLPRFETPEVMDSGGYLRHLVEQGVADRYGAERAASDEVLRERVERELGVICEMEFNDYFLIVWDICRHAREQGIWWNVRGSGAGSVVAFTLGITHLDPLRYNLLFERFLNRARVSLPDLDIDFPDDQRHEMMSYAVRRYGEERCAAIITFGTLGARAAIRDVGRVLQAPQAAIEAASRAFPKTPGLGLTLAQVLHPDEETSQSYEAVVAAFLAVREAWPEMEGVLATAAKLEGTVRQASTHAAGIVIADRPLVEYAPLARPTGNTSGSPVRQVIQLDMGDVEAKGLLKVDFLGLATLSLMRRACELIEQRHGRRLDLHTIPYERRHDDATADEEVRAAYELLQRGDTTEIFQVEGRGLTQLMREMSPTEFAHIVAAISLYRPGPMEYIPTYIRRMRGEEIIEYHHPLLEPILSDTFAVLIFQEQIARIAIDIGGYSPTEADLMRRAVSKKKAKDIEFHRGLFIAGALARGIEQEVAERIYGDIAYFARYGFNLSHACDYAILTVQTAFLKAHYPLEFLVAALNVRMGNLEKVGGLLAECRRRGISVLPPCINHSQVHFTIEQVAGGRDAVRIGLGSIKTVGEAAATLVMERGDRPFSSLTDLCQRVALKAVGKLALEALASVGALDALAPDMGRSSLMALVPRLQQRSQQYLEVARAGQMTLWDVPRGIDGEASPSAEEWLIGLDVPTEPNTPQSRRLKEEELVGWSWTNPLQWIPVSQRDMTHTLGRLPRRGRVIVFATRTRENTFATGPDREEAWWSVEDGIGQLEVRVGPELTKNTRRLKHGNPLRLVGTMRQKPGGSRYLWAEEVTTPLLDLTMRPQPIIPPANPTPPPPPQPPRGTPPPPRGDKPKGEHTASPTLQLPPPEAPTAQPPQLALPWRVWLYRQSNHHRDIAFFHRALTCLRSYPGPTSVEFVFVLEDGAHVVVATPTLSVTPGPELAQALLRQTRGVNIEIVHGDDTWLLAVQPPHPDTRAVGED